MEEIRNGSAELCFNRLALANREKDGSIRPFIRRKSLSPKGFHAATDSRAPAPRAHSLTSGTQTVQQPQILYDRETTLTVDQLLQERDTILRDAPADIGAPPRGTHASIAIFSAWAEGMLDDEYIEDYIKQYRDCPVCMDNYEYYGAIREGS